MEAESCGILMLNKCAEQAYTSLRMLIIKNTCIHMGQSPICYIKSINQPNEEICNAKICHIFSISY